VRYLADALGARTEWDDAARKVTISKDGTTLELVVGSLEITVNGAASQMDTAPVIAGSRTYLPARYIAEALGYAVEWNAAAQTVNIVARS